MAWLCVDDYGFEFICKTEPYRDELRKDWAGVQSYDKVRLSDGVIENFFGIKITWEDEPVEITVTVKE